MKENPELETYWISFPQDSRRPMGIGVTAYSIEDAFGLIRTQGFDAWFVGAREIKILSGVRPADIDQNHILPNSGPMQFRGVWYPAANIGWGAPRDPEFKRLGKDRT